MLEIACLIDAGPRAPDNDDRAAVNNKLISNGSYSEAAKTSCLVIVCDGVGGSACGDEAAEIVTKTFSLLNIKQLNIDTIKESIANANQAVLSARKIDFRHSKMATTIAGLYIHSNDFIAFNIGDSRIYRYRSPYIMQLSTDHSDPDHKNIITRCIGERAVPDIVDGTGRVFPNDIFVLCSDGVWGVLQNEDFEDVLSEGNNLAEYCQKLVSLALEKGSTDNLSIIVVRAN